MKSPNELFENIIISAEKLRIMDENRDVIIAYFNRHPEFNDDDLDDLLVRADNGELKTKERNSTCRYIRLT